MFIAVLRKPGSEELLGSGQGAGSQHLGAHRIRLELFEVHLEEGWSAAEKPPLWFPSQMYGVKSPSRLLMGDERVDKRTIAQYIPRDNP